MMHNETYLKTILTKTLRTSALASFNKDTPFSKTKKYSRTRHVQIYKKGLKHSMVCFRGDKYERTSLGMFWRIMCQRNWCLPPHFNENKGTWKWNLGYSETLPQSHNSSVYNDREELLKDCMDFFILFTERDTNTISIRTMICHSWRFRYDIGRLRYPLPLKNVLWMTYLFGALLPVSFTYP